MEKEKVIEKLEEVFEIACERYRKSREISLTEVRELGELLISSKTNIHRNMEKASKHLDARVKVAVEKQLHNQRIKERQGFINDSRN